jgi:cellobiose-specific phosphotransferase system component IIB
MLSLAELTMPSGEDGRAALIAWIQAKREHLDTYLARTVARRRRQLNLTLVAGTLAAALTAAPALGGKPAADWLTAALGLSSPAWRLLCVAGMICSLTATVTTQLAKSHNVDEHINRAQTARARLEMLEVGLSLPGYDYAAAAEECLQCIKDTAFIDRPRLAGAG